jgi:hypothetical protein
MPLSAAELEALIAQNGERREKERAEQGDNQDRMPFTADLILREEGGFELWLGGLDDAVNLDALEERNMGGVLNCALGECERECAPYRNTGMARRRTHARGPSGMKAGHDKHLEQEQAKAMANFDADWYSMMIGREIAYCSIDAQDEPGYPLQNHWSETHAFLVKCRSEGRKVLVHCVAGINRSSATLIAFLCEILHMKLDEAVELTSQHRGHILSNATFLAKLVERFDQSEAPSGGYSTISTM